VAERLELFLKRKDDVEKKTQTTMEEYFNLCAKRKQLALDMVKEVKEENRENREEKRYKPSSSLEKKKDVEKVPYIPVWIKKKDKVDEEVVPINYNEIEEGCEEEEDDEVEEEEEEGNIMKLEIRREQSVKFDLKAYITQNEDRLKKYVKKGAPSHYFGVPPKNEMFTYSYRRHWYLDYLTNGYTKNGVGALEYTKCAYHDKSLSMWGWKEVDVPREDIPRVMNSSYYMTYYAPNKEAGTIFKMTEVVETSEVCHRR
jgi:hypothetical protein